MCGSRADPGTAFKLQLRMSTYGAIYAAARDAGLSQEQFICRALSGYGVAVAKGDLGSNLVITDGAAVRKPLDLPRLQLKLAKTRWAKEMHRRLSIRAGTLVDRLAQELGDTRSPARACLDQAASALLEPVWMARCRLSYLKPKVDGVPASNRRRAPGGGRRRNNALRVLEADVRRALKRCGVSAGAWCADVGASAFLEILAACWAVASGQQVKPTALRRLAARHGRWKFCQRNNNINCCPIPAGS
jgi:hypothetical protein